MNRNAFILCTLLLLNVSAMGNVLAQSKVQPGRSEMNSVEADFVSEPIVLETPTASLYGTLERPRSPLPVPVVLIIAGSGPTDRDGNSAMLSGPNNCLKLLAEGLASHGIASVRYDKRAVGESGKAMLLAAEKAKIILREDDLRFDNYIDDAVLWGRKLRGDKRFTTVTFIGHSEGSLIGMVAAQRFGADGFVSLEGDGRPPEQLVLAQLKTQLPADLFKSTEDILEKLVVGKTVESVPAALNALFRPSIQPYLISWLRYNPAKEITALSMPVLIVQGTTDVQVGIEDAKWLADGNPSAKLLVVDGMNHVLKAVSIAQDPHVASYSNPSLPVDPRLVGALSAFVNDVKLQMTSNGFRPVSQVRH